MRLSDDNLAGYLADRKLLAQPDAARVEPAGDGNINFVRRVRSSDGSSLIVKQARDALERFPEYRVTTERIVFEHRYLRHVSDCSRECAGVVPGILDFDPDARVLVLEDLGTSRLDDRLANSPDDALAPIGTLGEFLGAVHANTRARVRELAPEFENGEMRALHGEHIFTLPYELGAFPLSESVRKAAEQALESPGVLTEIRTLRARYYESREALVHGDPQPGNVMLQQLRPRLIDAEIAHFGDPAFDLGTVLAHLEIHCLDGGRGAEALRDALTQGYVRGGGHESDLGRGRRYAGVEMLRRTIGAARVPVLESAAMGEAALARGVELVSGR